MDLTTAREINFAVKVSVIYPTWTQLHPVAVSVIANCSRASVEDSACVRDHEFSLSGSRWLSVESF
jgi:hypothetical protein